MRPGLTSATAPGRPWSDGLGGQAVVAAVRRLLQHRAAGGQRRCRSGPGRSGPRRGRGPSSRAVASPCVMARTIVSMSSRGVRPVSARKRAASPSVETSSIWAKIFARERARAQVVPAEHADGRRRRRERGASGSSVRRTARTRGGAEQQRGPARERRAAGERRRTVMSEILSGKEPGREGQRRGAEEPRWIRRRRER